MNFPRALRLGAQLDGGARCSHPMQFPPIAQLPELVEARIARDILLAKSLARRVSGAWQVGFHTESEVTQRKFGKPPPLESNPC